MMHLPHFGTSSHSIGLNGVGSGVSKHDQLKKNSQKLVSQAFYGTLLKQIHDSPFKSKLFDGGRGGEAFSSLLDQHLADRMAGGKTANGLVNSMVARLENPPGPPGTKRPMPSGRKSAAHHRIARKAYLNTPPKNRSQHVPANIRA